MADQEQTETAETEDAKKTEAVTMEQLQELQAKLTAITAAQSGSDRKVQELTAALTAANAAKETTVKTAEERIAELEKARADADAKVKRAELRTVARGLLDSVEMKPPAFFDRLIGNDEEETKQWVTAYIEDEKAKTAARNQSFDRDHGRTVEGPAKESPDAYGNLLEMSEEQLKRLGPKAVADIIKKAMG